MIFYQNKIRKIFSLEEIEIWHISSINYDLLLLSKNAKTTLVQRIHGIETRKSSSSSLY
jgi:hypothetical protein